jgi:hypothetical protein
VKTWLVCCAAAVASLTSTQALAQADVGVSGSALISIQPIDDWFGGSPYLDEGIGGLTPGVAAGVDVVTASGLVLVGEFSTVVPYEQEQSGRLVDTRRDRFSSGMSSTRLRDTLVSGLIGFAPGASHRLRLVGGVSWLHTDMTEDGIPVEEFGFEDSGDYRRVALTGGADFRAPLSSRVSLIISGRYSWIDRSEVAHDLGAGTHVIRASGGIRVRLN